MNAWTQGIFLVVRTAEPTFLKLAPVVAEPHEILDSSISEKATNSGLKTDDAYVILYPTLFGGRRGGGWSQTLLRIQKKL